MSRIKKGKVVNLAAIRNACQMLYEGQYETTGKKPIKVKTLAQALEIAGVDSNEFKRAYQFYLDYVIERGSK